MAYTLKLSDVEIMRYHMMAEQARTTEADLWKLAGIRAGARVADVGCGPGMLLAKLAEIVGPIGSAVGVDGDAAAVSYANAYLAEARAVNATARKGAADATGLEPNSFDAVVMRHVLAHNGGTEQRIVDHLASLVRPGGTVYLVDIYGGGIAMHPEIPAFAEIVDAYRRFMEGRGNDLAAGLKLSERLKQAGLTVEAFRGVYSIINPPPGIRPPAWAARGDMLAAGVITQDDIDRWEIALAEADALVSRPTIFNPMFVAVGRKPD